MGPTAAWKSCHHRHPGAQGFVCDLRSRAPPCRLPTRGCKLPAAPHPAVPAPLALLQLEAQQDTLFPQGHLCWVPCASFHQCRSSYLRRALPRGFWWCVSGLGDALILAPEDWLPPLLPPSPTPMTGGHAGVISRQSSRLALGRWWLLCMHARVCVGLVVQGGEREDSAHSFPPLFTGVSPSG